MKVAEMKIKLILLLISCTKFYKVSHSLQKHQIDRYESNRIINHIELEDIDYFITMIQSSKLSLNDFLTIDLKFLYEKDLNIDFNYFKIESDSKIRISILGYSILRNKLKMVETLLKESYDRFIEKILNINDRSYIDYFVAAILTKNRQMIKIVFDRKGQTFLSENSLNEIIKLTKNEGGLIEILGSLNKMGFLHFNENISKLFEISFIDIEYMQKNLIASSLSIAVEKRSLKTIQFLLNLREDLDNKVDLAPIQEVCNLKELCKVANLEIIKILEKEINSKELLTIILNLVEETYIEKGFSTDYIINLNKIIKYLIAKGTTLDGISLKFILKNRLRILDLRNILKEKNILECGNSKIESFFNFIYMSQETQQIQIFLNIEFKILSLINKYNLFKIDNKELKRQFKELAYSKIEPLMKPLISKSIFYLKSSNESFSLQEIFEVMKIYDLTETIIKILKDNNLGAFLKLLEKEEIKLSRLLLVENNINKELEEKNLLDLVCIYNNLEILKLILKRKKFFSDLMVLPSFLISQKLIYFYRNNIKILDLIIENSFIDEKIMEEMKAVDIKSYNYILQKIKFTSKMLKMRIKKFTQSQLI